MAVVTLLVKTDSTTFAFEHMMAHRTYFGAMTPLHQFSVLPYMLDPEIDTSIPAGSWNLNHQQAHNDLMGKMPATYGRFDFIGDIGGTPSVQPDPQGLFVGQNMRDTDLSDQDEQTWWTFQNHMEHHVANGTILPIPAGMPYQFPFW
jgi:hypothetical protein